MTRLIKARHLLALVIAGHCSPLMAAIPTVDDKGSAAASSGDWLDLLTAYLDVGTDPLAWAAVIMTFIIVLIAVIGKFNDARLNPRPPLGNFGLPGTKTEWSEVTLTAVVGVVILLLVIFVATQATQVI